jgi:hypothetical protein
MELKDRIEASEAASHSAEKRAAEQHRAAEAARAKAEASILQASLARRSADRAEAEGIARETELERARVALTQADANLDALRRSTSWRLTAPLRVLARLLRGR